MPQDSQGDSEHQPAIGRTYRAEVGVPITTPSAVAARAAARATHAGKPGAVDVLVYFVSRGIDNPILQASMLAYTEVRVAPPEVFDEIFAPHHGPAPEESKAR